MVASIYRLVKYWHAGTFNPKNAPRSFTFAFKLVLQSVMCIINLTFTINITDGGDSSDHFDFDHRNLVYPVYGLVWLWSIYVQFFEYKRGLPHSWYCHQSFWALSFLSQTAILIVILVDGDKFL